MKVLSFFCCLLLLVCTPGSVFGMTSTHYQINWDSLNEGGLDNSTSTNYQMFSTIGEPVAGTSTSSNYKLQAGYRAGDAATRLALTVRVQDPGAGVAYTEFANLAGIIYQVKVPITGFSVGDYIAVVENVGFAQKVAVGRVIGASSGALDVDSWSGDQSSMTTFVSGGNDFVYKLSGTNSVFGTLTVGAQHVSVTMTSVDANTAGYTVYVNANQILQTPGGALMASVSDGSVSVGSEEYGAAATGLRAVHPGQDLAVTTTLRSIQSSATPTGNTPDRIPLIYKLSVTSSTAPGSYSQDVYYTLTGNF